MRPDQWEIVAERANHAISEVVKFLRRVNRAAVLGVDPSDTWDDMIEDGELARNAAIRALDACGIEITHEYPLQVLAHCVVLASPETHDLYNVTACKTEIVSLTDFNRIMEYQGRLRQCVMTRANEAIDRIVRQQ